MKDVRLQLISPYNYGKGYSNSIGFVRTIALLGIGQVFKFEDLHPYSLGGDLNVDHYKHFEGKTFKVTSTMATRVRNGWEAIEIETP